MKFVRAEDSRSEYVICNADESEPGLAKTAVMEMIRIS